ncbi:hypothetical protein ABEB36_010079 [Hypothenemus hampei]|uniref:2-phosphoxylose phosphatase 1 n=1 Tax=Hypothenemus hampei TaxID=57062 RepID=A0ABD1EIF8_HYPHA
MILQNRAVNCYFILIVWILLAILGFYKFLDRNHDVSPLAPVVTKLFRNLGISSGKSRKIFGICNFPEDIYQGNEGIFDGQWSLKGTIILIRHGDRGPLQHLKQITDINCNTPETNIITSYKSYLHNLTVTGKLQWTGLGPFHNFPLLPPHPDRCLLGQLTMQGVSQLLNLGLILRRSYESVWPQLLRLRDDQILVYSTRYRRTFQSAIAFLFGLISNETLAKLTIFESQSMSFCFKDCECPITDSLKKLVHKSELHQLQHHPAVDTLSQNTGKLLLSTDAEHSPLMKDPNVIRDSLLAFVCHKTGLPCEDPTNCIRKGNVAGIITYTEWINFQKWKNVHWKRLCLLKSYGQIRHIVQQMLHFVGSNGPKLVLYSGHDFTLLQLATALGLANDPLLLRYASRLIFEVYQDNRAIGNNEEKAIYFRLLSNGRDVTKQIIFCRNLVNLDRSSALCRIEDIVRFLHDDYFSSLNVTNFKDACIKKGENSENDFLQF